ncbi:MAG: phosphatidylserine decarboxylase [Alphaproteobacteria bacterium]|nr:phosphatidylserine decarboxylase [Alphaproteobacteria bacterium]
MSNRPDLSWKHFILPPINNEGKRFVLIFAAVTLLFFAIHAVFLGELLTVLTIWCYYFFRDPKRAIPQGESLVLSPADGTVSKIEEMVPPSELELGTEPMTRISIFMSVFNVHVNRAPMAGKILTVNHIPGAFVNVSLDKESENNERTLLSMETTKGTKIAFVQIAGLVARRIVTQVKPGDELKAGERFGLIRFGSRLDVYIPKTVAPKVQVGQLAIAGETILADLDVNGEALKGEMI